jgi:hypothetical protein
MKGSAFHVLMATAVGLAAAVLPAYAVEPFFVELQAKYVKPDSQEPSDVALQAAFEQAGCTICHPGDDKQRLTRYGGHVGARINKFDAEKKDKIHQAFDEVGALRSDPHDRRSPTYDQLFRQGKLPADGGR